MEPSIEAYNDSIHNDSTTFWDKLAVDAPNIIYHPDLEKYNQLIKILFSRSCIINYDDLYIGTSHEEIVQAINRWKIDKPFHIVNIDHHHDLGYTEKRSNKEIYYQQLKCSNWVTHLAQSNPNFQKYIWIRNQNSESDIDNYAKEKVQLYDNSIDINLVLSMKFNKVFICKSPGWVPPNVMPLYDSLVLSYSTFIKRGIL